MHDNLFSTIKQNLAEGLYVGVQYLTHKEIISHQKLVLEYVQIGFELFKEFFSTVLSNTGRDLSALRAQAPSVSRLINLTVMDCNDCMRDSKSPELTDLMKKFLDELAASFLRINTDELFDITPEVKAILKAANPLSLVMMRMENLVDRIHDPKPKEEGSGVSQHPKAVQEPSGSGTTSKLAQSSGMDDKLPTNAIAGLSALAGSAKASKYKQLWKVGTADLVRKGFEAIALEDYYQEEVEAEFQKLIYKGQDKETTSNFNGFLIGLMTYVQAEIVSVSDAVLSIFFNIAQSFLVTSKAEEMQGKTLKSKQSFMLKHGLIEVIVKVILLRSSPAVIFDGLECGITLMYECNPQVQSAIKQAIKQQGSYLVFTKLITIVDNYLESIERSMMKLNSAVLMEYLLNTSNEDDIKTDEQVKILTKIKKVQLFFDFLKFLCEGHNSELQEFLRDQTYEAKPESAAAGLPGGFLPESIVNVLGISEETQINMNIVQYAAEVFQSVSKYLNRDTISLGQSVLQFLIEAVQGPSQGNQKTLLEQEIFISCKDVLWDLNQSNHINLRTRGLYHSDPATRNMTSAVIKAVVKLLEALLEGNESEELISDLGSIIDFKLLMDPLVEEYRNYFSMNFGIAPKQLTETPLKKLMSKIKGSAFTGTIFDCLEIFVFLRTINENSTHYERKIKSLRGLAKFAFEFYMENTSHIEINFRNNITRSYFVKHPACLYLSEEVQQELMNTVSRDTPNQKVSDFVNASQSMFNRMEYVQLLITKYRVNPKYVVHFRKLSLFICALLNTYLFSFSKMEVSLNQDQDNNELTSGELVMILAWIYCFTNSVSLFFFAVENVYLTVINRWSKWIFELKYLKDISPVDQIWLTHMIDKDSFQLSQQDYIDLVVFKRKYQGGSKPRFPRLIKLAYDLKFVGGEFWLQLFFTICFLMGIVTGDKWFFCFPLLDIMSMSSTLMALLQAVTLNGDQIVLAVGLVVIIIFLYSLYAYYYVLDTFWNSSFGTAGENQCTSVRHCFFTIFSLGPRSSGSIGDMLLRMSYAPDNLAKWYNRYIFDLTIFVIVNVLGMNIIFGIIIQTFAAIREQLNFRTQDKENVCFACSLEKNEIEKTVRGFEFHINVDHNIWNYLYFIYYLKKKPVDDHTGPHSDVRQKISKDDIFWFPFGKCIALKHEQSKNLQGTSRMDTLSIQLEKLTVKEKPKDETSAAADQNERTLTEIMPSTTHREGAKATAEPTELLILRLPGDNDQLSELPF